MRAIACTLQGIFPRSFEHEIDTTVSTAAIDFVNIISSKTERLTYQLLTFSSANFFKGVRSGACDHVADELRSCPATPN